MSATKSFSSIRSQVKKPESLVLELINNGRPVTCSSLNEILFNQNILVTDAKLESLLKVKGVELDLPVSTPANKKLLIELTGKSQYSGFSGGIHIYTEKYRSEICRFI